MKLTVYTAGGAVGFRTACRSCGAEVREEARIDGPLRPMLAGLELLLDGRSHTLEVPGAYECQPCVERGRNGSAEAPAAAVG